jgi:glycosyl transferase family 25
MTLFNGFDRIRIINLPSRGDRRTEMLGELRRIGLALDTRVKFVEGVTVPANEMLPWRAPGEKGVFLAQLNVLRDAAKANESVLILEDDVDFTPAATTWSRGENVDIAYGGYLAMDPDDLENSDIAGAHCIGFSSRAAQALVPFLEGLFDHSSPPPIDGAYVWFRRQRDGFKTAFARPVVAIQRPSRSDITPKRTIDGIAFLRGPVGSARNIKRKLQRGELTFGLPEAIVIAIIGIAIASAAAYYHLHYGGPSGHG